MVRKEILASSRNLRRKRFFFKAAIFAVLLLFLFAGVSALFYIPKFMVQNISVSGNSVLSGDEITAKVFDSLSGKYYAIFPRDNILIVPEEEIKNNLLNNFPRAKNVFLSKDFPNSLIINIVERNPAALFCGGAPEKSASPERGEANEECSFVDEDGLIFEKAAFFSGNVYVKFYGGKNTKKINSFAEMAEFVEMSADEGVTIVKVVFGKDSLREFYSSEGWRVLLNESDDFEKAAVNLKLALDKQIKEKRKNLDYIDLRFGKKVYYKFK